MMASEWLSQAETDITKAAAAETTAQDTTSTTQWSFRRRRRRVVESDEAAFCASWRRPKWNALSQGMGAHHV